MIVLYPFILTAYLVMYQARIADQTVAEAILPLALMLFGFLTLIDIRLIFVAIDPESVAGPMSRPACERTLPTLSCLVQ
jgi:hypothetical protein